MWGFLIFMWGISWRIFSPVALGAESVDLATKERSGYEDMESGYEDIDLHICNCTTEMGLIK